MDESIRWSLLFIALTSLAIWLVGSSIVFSRYKAPLYHPIGLYCIYHFIGYVYRPAVVSLSGHSPIWIWTRVTPDISSLWLSAVVDNVGFVTMIATMAYIYRRHTLPLLTLPSIEMRSKSFFLISVLVLLTAGVYSTYVSYGNLSVGALQSYNVSIDLSGGQRLVGISGYETALAELLGPIFILLFSISATRMYGIAFIAAYIAVRFAIGVGRSDFVAVMLGLGGMLLVLRKSRFPPAYALVAILCFAFVFDVIGSDRFTVRKLASGEASITDVLDRYSAARGGGGLTNDMAEFDVLSSELTVVPSQTGWSFGTQFLRLIIWPIPRQLWEEKPVYTSRINLNEYGNFLFLTQTLYADMYMVGGLLVFPLLMALMSLYLCGVYNIAARQRSAFGYYFYWINFMYLPLVFRDGILSPIYFAAVASLGIFLVIRMGGIRIWRPT